MALAVLGVMAMIWALGRRLRWPKVMVWGLIVLVYGAALGFQFVVDGGNPAPWAIVGGIVALVAAYAFGLSRLKSRVKLEPETKSQGTFREA